MCSIIGPLSVSNRQNSRNGMHSDCKHQICFIQGRTTGRRVLEAEAVHVSSTAMTVTGFSGEQSFQCLAVGDPVTDILANVSYEDLTNINTACEAGGCATVGNEEWSKLKQFLATRGANSVLHSPGGSAANVITCISSLSPRASCHFTGGIGEDEVAEAFSEHLKCFSVHPHLAKTPHPSAVALCLITPDGQRTMRVCLGAAQAFNRYNLPAAQLQTSNLVHCEGYTLYKPEVLQAAAEAAHSAGSTFSLDLASFEVIRNNWGVLLRVLEQRNVDIAFCNEDEAAEIVNQANLATDQSTDECDIESTIQAAGEFLSRYCQLAVFTLGKRGAVVMSKGRKVARCSACTVQVVDTVGAGDTFCGAFLSAYMQGGCLQACVDIACMAGSECVKHPGARLPRESWQPLQQRLGVLLEQSTERASPVQTIDTRQVLNVV